MSEGRYTRFGSVLDRCESPIERFFLLGLLFMGDYTFEPLPAERAPAVAVDRTGIILSVQVQVGDYRIDATLSRPGASQRFAVELDGHAYHGSTPAQFERDSARQRALTAKGWTFLRFAGRELMRDPRKCAAEAMFAAASMVDAAPTMPTAAPALTPAQQRVRRVREAEDRGDWSGALRELAEAGEDARRRHGLAG